MDVIMLDINGLIPVFRKEFLLKFLELDTEEAKLIAFPFGSTLQWSIENLVREVEYLAEATRHDKLTRRLTASVVVGQSHAHECSDECHRLAAKREDLKIWRTALHEALEYYCEVLSDSCLDQHREFISKCVTHALLRLPVVMTPVMYAEKFGLSLERRTAGSTAWRQALGPYQRGDLEVVFYHSSSQRTRDQFDEWVKGLNLEADNEIGGDDGTIRWVRENDVVRVDPYKTVIFYDPGLDQIVATGSFVQDDRGVAERLGLIQRGGYLGIWGFFQVRRELRGFGLGTIVAKYIDNFVQEHVDGCGTSKMVYLFTSGVPAIKICSKLGFRPTNEIINIPGFDLNETLFKKLYSPRISSSAAIDSKPVGAPKHNKRFIVGLLLQWVMDIICSVAVANYFGFSIVSNSILPDRFGIALPLIAKLSISIIVGGVFLYRLRKIKPRYPGSRDKKPS